MQYDWNLVLTLLQIVERKSLHPKLDTMISAAQAELDQLQAGEHASQNPEDE